MYLEAVIPQTSPRFIIVHYHIFKNGGTTIEHVLDREFSGRFATLHGHASDSVLDSKDLVQFLKQHPEIAAVSSHHLRYPKPRSRKTVFFDCCFLRDPIDRLYSSYKHFRRSASDDTYSRWARSCSPSEFAERLCDQYPHQVSNVQVNQLANAGNFMRPLNDRDLDQAVAVVRDMAIPGLVEMFEESMTIAEYFLSPAFPAIRLEYSPQNVSPSRCGLPVNAKNDWCDIWGSTLHARLLRLNALDLELIRRTRIEILRRLESMPRFPERLAEFRTRCARLSAQPRHHRESPRVMAASASAGGGSQSDIAAADDL